MNDELVKTWIPINLVLNILVLNVRRRSTQYQMIRSK